MTPMAINALIWTLMSLAALATVTAIPGVVVAAGLIGLAALLADRSKD